MATPRDVKIFINQVVALASVWREAIPLVLLGVHVILKKCEMLSERTATEGSETRDSFLQMLEAWVPKKRTSQESYPSLEEFLLAVELNVDPKRALEIHRFKDFADLLSSGNTDQLLARFHGSANLAHIMERILVNYSEAWAMTSPNTLCHAWCSVRFVRSSQRAFH